MQVQSTGCLKKLALAPKYNIGSYPTAPNLLKEAEHGLNMAGNIQEWFFGIIKLPEIVTGRCPFFFFVQKEIILAQKCIMVKDSPSRLKYV